MTEREREQGWVRNGSGFKLERERVSRCRVSERAREIQRKGETEKRESENWYDVHGYHSR